MTSILVFERLLHVLLFPYYYFQAPLAYLAWFNSLYQTLKTVNFKSVSPVYPCKLVLSLIYTTFLHKNPFSACFTLLQWQCPRFSAVLHAASRTCSTNLSSEFKWFFWRTQTASTMNLTRGVTISAWSTAPRRFNLSPHNRENSLSSTFFPPFVSPSSNSTPATFISSYLSIFHISASKPLQIPSCWTAKILNVLHRLHYRQDWLSFQLLEEYLHANLPVFFTILIRHRGSHYYR